MNKDRTGTNVYMIEGGITATDAIKAATINATELLGMKDQLGTIQVGKFADVVAVDGDPLTGSIVFVKKCFCDER